MKQKLRIKQDAAEFTDGPTYTWPDPKQPAVRVVRVDVEHKTIYLESA